jgi:hypothetical protein
VEKNGLRLSQQQVIITSQALTLLSHAQKKTTALWVQKKSLDRSNIAQHQ